MINISNTDKLIKLIDACCDIVERREFRPAFGLTHCNEAVSYVARCLDYDKFRGMEANQIVDFMGRSDDWRLIDIAQSQNIANMGGLVIAGEQAEPHGHVCVIRPGIMKPAGHWGCLAPMVANVGGVNFISEGLNFAFREKPRIWELKQEVTQ